MVLNRSLIRRVYRRVVLVVLVGMVGSGLPGLAFVATVPAGAASAATSAPTAPKPGGEPAGPQPPPANTELDLLRTETSRTFTTDKEGVMRKEIFSAPVNFKDGAGKWQKIDASIERKGGNGVLATKSTPTPVELADSAATGSLAKLDVGAGKSVGFRVEGAKDAKAKVDGDKAIYDEVLDGVAVELTTLPQGVKEELVLRDAHQTSFAFPLDLAGLTPRESADRGIEFTDADGTVQAVIPPGVMNDSLRDERHPRGAQSNGVSMRLRKTAAGWTVDVDVDKKWLRSPDRVFPVRVDPTLVHGLPDDTFVTALVANEVNNSNQPFLSIGNTTLSTRSFIHFNQAELVPLKATNIISADLSLWETGSGSCTPSQMDAYRVTQAWTGSAMPATKWPGPAAPLEYPAGISNQIGSFYGAKGFSAACPAGPIAFSILPAVQNWASGTWANDGLMLRATDEVTVSHYKTFSSAQGSNPPSISVTYGTQLADITPDTPITVDTVWGPENSPYIVSGNVGVTATLTLLPGTVVKFKPAAHLQFGGQFGTEAQLLSLGTVTNPVVFTSFKDDSVGGDSNDDGAATTPARGDWGGISTSAWSPRFHVIDNSIVRFGGANSDGSCRPMLWGPHFYITNSRVESACGQSLAADAPAQVHNSTFKNSPGGVAAGMVYVASDSTFMNNTFEAPSGTRAFETSGNGGGPMMMYNTFKSGSVFFWTSSPDTIKFNSFLNDTTGGTGTQCCTVYPFLQRNWWGHRIDVVGQCGTTYPYNFPTVKLENGNVNCPGGYITAIGGALQVTPGLMGPPPSESSAITDAEHARFGPVDAKTGELQYGAADMQVHDAGQTLDFARVYRSGVAGAPPLSGELGAGWQISYTEKVAVPPSGSDPYANPYKFTMPGGSAFNFVADPNAGTVTSPGNDGAFQKNGDNTMDMVAKDNKRYHFDALGQLTSVVNRDPGHVVDVAASGGLVTKVTGVSGRFVDYAHSSGKLSSLTDSQSRKVEYGYDGQGRLATAKTVDGRTYTYGYDGTTSRLVSVTSPMGRLGLQVGYDPGGRVAWYEESGKGRITVAYYPFERYTTFTRVDGAVTRIDWDQQGRSVREQVVGERASHTMHDGAGRWLAQAQGVPMTKAVGYTPMVSASGYDLAGNQVSAIDAFGAVTSTTFDANHLPLVTTYPAADPFTPATTMARVYDSNRRITKLTDQTGKIWLAAYNTFGQLIKLSDPLSTCSNQTDVNSCTTRVAQWQYNTTTIPKGDILWSKNSAGTGTEAAPVDWERTDFVTDALGRVTKTTDPFQRSQAVPKSTLTTYLPSGAVDTFTTPRGAVSRTFYDNDSQPVRLELPEGAATWFLYDGFGRPTQKIDTNTLITPIPVTPPACTDTRVSCTTLGYDTAGRSNSVTDPRGKTYTRSYNFSDLTTETKDPLNARVQTVYDAAGRVVEAKQEIEPNVFLSTIQTYDHMGRSKTVTYPDGGVDAYGYDALGRQVSHTTPRGGTWMTKYDGLGRPVQVSDPLHENDWWQNPPQNWRQINMTYDAIGNLLTKTDQLGRKTTYTYDSVDRPTGVFDNGGASMTTAGYLLGRKAWQKDGEGNQTSFDYNDDNQLVKTTDPEGGITTVTLDLNGRVKLTTDPNSAKVAVDYDALGHPKERRFDDGTKEVMTYDVVGNPLTKTDRANQTWSNVFDDVNRIWKEIDPQNGALKPTVHAYNLAGWQTSITDPSGLAVNFGYDSMGRTNQQWTAQNASNRDTWSYDTDGQLAVETVGGATTRHYYDRGGWPDYDRDGANNHYEITTNKAGEVVSTQAPNENPTVVTYDTRGRKKTEAIQPVDGTTYTTTFNYDKANRLTSQQLPSGRTDAWDYYKTGWVKAAKVGSVTGPAGPFVTSTSYDYYAGGQLKNSNLPGGGQFHYDYTPTFEQVKTETRPDASIWNYDWTGERLTQTRPPSGVNIVNTYDNDGRLTQQDAGGRSRKFGYDPAGRPTSVDNRVLVENITTYAVLVVNNKAALTAGDTALKNRLTSSEGYSVTVVSTADAVNVTGQDIVVIAPTANVANKYATVAVPVVDLRADSWDDHKLSTTAGASVSATTGWVEGAQHRIADGARERITGTPSLFSSAANEAAVADGALGAGASQVVARQQTPADQNLVFAYESGAALASGGGNAVARRVAFGVDDAGVGKLSAVGWNLFDNAVIWARGTERQPSGALLTYGYTNGLITSSNGPNGNSTYHYDAFARLDSATVDAGTPNATTTGYEYTTDGRALLAKVTGPVTANYNYDGTGRMYEMTAGQVRETFGFDKASRVTSQNFYVAGAATWGSATSYKPDGQVATRSQAVANTANSFVDTFGYDNAGRLKTMARAKGTPVTATVSLTYRYDAKGNRDQIQVSGVTNAGADDPTSAAAFGVLNNTSITYTFDNAGKMLTGSNASTYAYDADGRLKDSTTPIEGRRLYNYDPFGDLASVDKVAGATTRMVTWTRDGYGRPLTRSQPGQTYETFAYDGKSSEVIQYNNRNVSWGKTLSVVGPAGGMIGTVDPLNGAQIAEHSQHGDLVAMAPVDPAKGTVNSVTMTYDPYGHQTKSGSAAVPLGFQGQIQDPSTSLVDMGARMYNPNAAGFIQPDSYAGDPAKPASLNRYAYGNGDPVTNADPSGHSAVGTVMSVAAPSRLEVLRSMAQNIAEGMRAYLYSAFASEGDEQDQAYFKAAVVDAGMNCSEAMIGTSPDTTAKCLKTYARKWRVIKQQDQCAHSGNVPHGESCLSPEEALQLAENSSKVVRSQGEAFCGDVSYVSDFCNGNNRFWERFWGAAKAANAPIQDLINHPSFDKVEAFVEQTGNHIKEECGKGTFECVMSLGGPITEFAGCMGSAIGSADPAGDIGACAGKLAYDMAPALISGGAALFEKLIMGELKASGLMPKFGGKGSKDGPGDAEVVAGGDAAAAGGSTASRGAASGSSGTLDPSLCPGSCGFPRETPVMVKPPPSNPARAYMEPGPYANRSIPARGPSQSFNTSERAMIDKMGAEDGCHTCGARTTKLKHYTPDHQPVVAMNPQKAPMRLYPHCNGKGGCSPRQGGYVSAWIAKWR